MHPMVSACCGQEPEKDVVLVFMASCAEIFESVSDQLRAFVSSISSGWKALYAIQVVGEHLAAGLSLLQQYSVLEP